MSTSGAVSRAHGEETEQERTPEQEAERSERVARAEIEAARVPLATARACVEVIEVATAAATHGNPNAVTDAGVAGLLAGAGAEGAILNVEINLKALAPSADKEDVQQQLLQLRESLAAASGACREAVRAAMSA